MKKAYTKPVITFEDFAFSSNVAGECGGLKQMGLLTEATRCDLYATTGTPETCGFYDNGVAMFTKDEDCLARPDGEDFRNLCYHVNTAATKVFKS